MTKFMSILANLFVCISIYLLKNIISFAYFYFKKELYKSTKHLYFPPISLHLSQLEKQKDRCACMRFICKILFAVLFFGRCCPVVATWLNTFG